MKKICVFSFLLVSSFLNSCCDGSTVAHVPVATCFDQEDVLKAALKGFNLGKAEGFENGMSVGAERGVIAGFEYGRKQGVVDGFSLSATMASNSLTFTDMVGELKRGKSWKDSLKGAARTCIFGAAPRVMSHVLTKPDATNEQKQSVAAICGWLSLANVLRIGYKNCKLVQKTAKKDSVVQTDTCVDLITEESCFYDERYQKLVQSEYDIRQKYNALKDDVITYGNNLEISAADKIILRELFRSLREFFKPVLEEEQGLEPESAEAEWAPFGQKDDSTKWKKRAGW